MTAREYDICKHVSICEQASAAAFSCDPYAATLCVSGDANVRFANLPARPHDRAHVLPFFLSPTHPVNPDPNVDAAVDFFLKLTDGYEAEEVEQVSKKIKDDGRCHHDDAVDPYLVPDHQYGYTLVTGTETPKFHVAGEQDGSVQPQPPPVGHELDNFTNLNQTARSNYAPSQSPSARVSSEFGKVPEGSAATDMTPDSHEQYWLREGQTAVERVARGMDREARLMRYREKRKNRKFQKTIRYASRKAYAETRPRVKGRFVKRAEMGGYSPHAAVADSIYASSAGYGVVPSF